MSPVRAALIALGVGALGVALAFVFVPSLAPALGDGPFVALTAVVLAAFTVGEIQRRRQTERQQAPAGSPETRRTFFHPGTEVDRALRIGRTGTTSAAAPHGMSLSERVRPIAVDVIARARNCSTAEAERLLDEGEWSDDAYAVAYFSSKRAAELYEDERGVVGSLLGRRPDRSTLARRAILELAAMDETGRVAPETVDRRGATDAPEGEEPTAAPADAPTAPDESASADGGEP